MTDQPECGPACTEQHTYRVSCQQSPAARMTSAFAALIAEPPLYEPSHRWVPPTDTTRAETTASSRHTPTEGA